MLKVLIGYPTPTEEFVIVERMTGQLQDLQKVLTTDQLLKLQKEADKVYVDPALMEYAVRMVSATRNPKEVGVPDLQKYIMFGASPRASINLILGLFNLVPGFPLDGGRVLRSVVWWITGSYEKGTLVASLAGQGIGALLLMVGLAAVFAQGLEGLWICLVGYYLPNDHAKQACKHAAKKLAEAFEAPKNEKVASARR